MLDIVIPALNEENYIGLLLTSLEKQTYKDFTVFISDGNSTDNTIAVAKKFSKTLNVRMLANSKQSVACQRNSGAKAGNAPHILFLDADVVLHPNFLFSLMRDVKEKDLANCWVYPLSKKQIDKVFFQLYNLLVLEVGQYLWPTGMGGCLYTTRKLFNELGGFDEKLEFWEDIDFVKRAIKKGATYAILRKPRMYLSVRSFELEGRISYILYVLEGLKGVFHTMRTGRNPDARHVSYLSYSDLVKRKKYSSKKARNSMIQYKTYIKLLKKIQAKSLQMPTKEQFISLFKEKSDK